MKQCGSALISALFIMTLVAIAATAMSTRLQLDIYRTRLTINSDKLYLASEIVTFWAMAELADKNQLLTKADKLGKVLNFPGRFANIYPNFSIQGSLYDLQSRFNLNDLNDKQAQAVFLRLLQSTAHELNPSQAKAITLATSDWITPYQPGIGSNDYFNDYLKQSPPYYPSHQPMDEVSEFRLVQGVSSKIYQASVAYLSALPKTTPINLNTASRTLLKALSSANESQINELIKARGDSGFKELNKVNPLLKKLAIPNRLVSIESQYFMSIATVKADDLTLVNCSLLKRSGDKNGKMTVIVLKVSLNC